MNAKIESMHVSQVWDRVTTLEGIKLIGCKWVYKRKREVDRKFETFNVRLIAKGFTQTKWIDYEETFSPIAIFKSIRVFLTIACHYDYKIWQINIKTTFFNGNLSENIYISQLEEFIVRGQEHIVYKLKRSIYGF
jgi:hypothetical protein